MLYLTSTGCADTSAMHNLRLVPLIYSVKVISYPDLLTLLEKTSCKICFHYIMMLQECDTLYDCTCATFPVKRTAYVVTLSLEMLMMLLGMVIPENICAIPQAILKAWAGVWTRRAGGMCVCVCVFFFPVLDFEAFLATVCCSTK